MKKNVQSNGVRSHFSCEARQTVAKEEQYPFMLFTMYSGTGFVAKSLHDKVPVQR
jgi:hypothetical protein